MLAQQYLVILLVKLAVAASVASLLTRSSRFLSMILREDRTLPQRLQLAFGCALLFASGAATRILTENTYQAVDLGLEGSFLLGLIGGYMSGLTGGILISLPAMFHGEFMSMPVFAAVGTVGGLLRDLAPEKEDVWKFTPFVDLNLWRVIRRRQLKRNFFSLACAFAIVLCEAVRILVAELFPVRGMFSLARYWNDYSPWTLAAIVITTLFSVSLPLRIWNASRTERQLEGQQRLLNEARLAALSRQINPHFLFNTLNSVASLIRVNPDQARQVVYRLAAIMRRLLRKGDALSPLRDELAFVEDYLAIEMVRFGDKLRFDKDVAPETLDRLVPSMMLQPLVENSIRHGLSSKVAGGTIRVRAFLTGGRLQVLVEDDGVGIPEEKLAALFEQGIGMSNTNERLKVLFGEDYRMWVDSKPGEGTTTGIELPASAAARAAS
jgi:two-component system LytT family sensor kinase